MAFDKMSLARDTKQNIIDNKTKLAPFEVAIATDTDEMCWVDGEYTFHTTGGKRTSSPTEGGDVLATAEAVKLAYQKAVDAYNLATTKVDNTTQVIAGSGLQGGGALTGNVSLSLKFADGTLMAGSSGVYVVMMDSVASTAQLPATANAVKVAYDTGVHGQNLANQANANAENRCPKWAGNGELHINGWAIHIN